MENSFNASVRFCGIESDPIEEVSMGGQNEVPMQSVDISSPASTSNISIAYSIKALTTPILSPQQSKRTVALQVQPATLNFTNDIGEQKSTERDKTLYKKGKTGLKRQSTYSCKRSKINILLPFELFYPLEKMEERHIRDVLNGTRADDDEIVNMLFENEHTKMTITKKSLRTCQGQSWINDEVINYYLSLLRLRDEEMATYNSNHCRCYFFTTYYYSNKVEPLVKNKFGDGQTERIKKWIEKQNAFNFPIWIFTIHVNGNHWILVLVDSIYGTLDLYDSWPNTKQGRRLQSQILDNIWKFINMLCNNRNSTTDVFKVSSNIWDFNIVHNCPKQHNNYDCGVFACTFASLLSTKRTASFKTKPGLIRLFRKRLVLSIIQHRI